MWLVSVSKRSPFVDGPIPTTEWPDAWVEHASALMDRVLGDAGDTAIERQFRMCVTMCRHRATTRAERDALPEWFRCFRPRDIAGAPVAVLWSRGVPDELDATRPCLSPGKRPIPGGEHAFPRLYVPEPCERCAACLDNEAVRQSVDAFRNGNPGAYLLDTR